MSFKKQFTELWYRRELLVELFKATIKLQHVGSVLGYLWTLLNPLMYIATYWIVFTTFIRMGLDNYPLFLIPGYLAWNFTFNSLLTSSNSIIQGNHLLNKIAFPIEILPLTSIGISLFDYLISMLIYFIALLIIPGISVISYQLLLFPVLLLILILITTGLALIVACLSVYFRDIPQLVQVGGTIFFFLTPIFYPLDFIPEKIRTILIFNPIAQVIVYFQKIFYYGTFPDTGHLVLTFIISVLIFFTGLAIFNNHKYSFAELS